MQLLKDFLLPGTPFRGLILRSEYCPCAYIGVPQSHWLADMESLEFRCHFGVTFNGPGGDSQRPAGWYWYGWDYGHFTDFLDLPAEVKAHFEETGLPIPFSTGKRWTVEEIEHDIVDVAVGLLESLEQAERQAGQVLPNPLDSRD